MKSCSRFTSIAVLCWLLQFCIFQQCLTLREGKAQLPGCSRTSSNGDCSTPVELLDEVELQQIEFQLEESDEAHLLSVDLLQQDLAIEDPVGNKGGINATFEAEDAKLNSLQAERKRLEQIAEQAALLMQEANVGLKELESEVKESDLKESELQESEQKDSDQESELKEPAVQESALKESDTNFKESDLKDHGRDDSITLQAANDTAFSSTMEVQSTSLVGSQTIASEPNDLQATNSSSSGDSSERNAVASLVFLSAITPDSSVSAPPAPELDQNNAPDGTWTRTLQRRLRHTKEPNQVEVADDRSDWLGPKIAIIKIIVVLLLWLVVGFLSLRCSSRLEVDIDKEAILAKIYQAAETESAQKYIQREIESQLSFTGT